MGFGHPLHVAYATLNFDGAGGIRTHDLRFRKPSLYPAELQPHWNELCLRGIMDFESRRGDRNRYLFAKCIQYSIEESPGSYLAKLAG